MVDPNVIASRLSMLEGYRAKLESIRKLSREHYLADEDTQLLAERCLHLACECMLDLAQHVVSGQGFRQPENYKDTMEVLREAGILEDELAAQLKKWMGFRNVLVHLYLQIDHGETYSTIQNDLDDLRDFSAAMVKLFEV